MSTDELEVISVDDVPEDAKILHCGAVLSEGGAIGRVDLSELERPDVIGDGPE